MDGSLSRSRRRARSSRGPEQTDCQKILKQGPKQRSLYALPGWQKSAVQTRAPSFLPARTPAARLVPPIQQPAHPAPGIPAWLLTDTRPSLLQAKAYPPHALGPPSHAEFYRHNRVPGTTDHLDPVAKGALTTAATAVHLHINNLSVLRPIEM